MKKMAVNLMGTVDTLGVCDKKGEYRLRGSSKKAVGAALFCFVEEQLFLFVSHAAHATIVCLN